jgi:hypothetical protein
LAQKKQKPKSRRNAQHAGSEASRLLLHDV